MKYHDMNNTSLEIQSISSSSIPSTTSSPAPESVPSFELNDTGNAKRLGQLMMYQLIHVFELEKWLFWDNQSWVAMTHLHENAIADVVIESIKLESERIKKTEKAQKTVKKTDSEKLASWAIKLGNHNEINRMFARARGIDGLAKSTKELDTDPLKISVSNGTIDLQTGVLLPHNPLDYITKVVPIKLAIDGDLPPSKIAPTPAPRWIQFLNEIFNGDQEIIHLIHKWVGYCLSGETKEQKLMFFWGAGSNGKSVFTKILELLLGDYHYKVPAAFLMAKENRGNDAEKPSPFKMNTMGKRLIVANEIAENSRLDDALIKDLTGGDTISARNLNKGTVVEWRPQTKIILVGNHKPTLNGSDYAMKRRILLVPFTQCFEGNAIDPDLESKLTAELPGIMAWAIEGYNLWTQEGLTPPQSILTETADYFNENDMVGRFISDCCQLTGNPADFALSSKLYQAYQNWATLNGEKATLNQNNFGKKLKSKGLRNDKLNIRAFKGKMAWIGINLLPSEDLLTAPRQAPGGHHVGTTSGTMMQNSDNKEPCGSTEAAPCGTMSSTIEAVRENIDDDDGRDIPINTLVAEKVAVDMVPHGAAIETPHEHWINSGTMSTDKHGADVVPDVVPVALPYPLNQFRDFLSGLPLNREDVDHLNRKIRGLRNQSAVVQGYIRAFRDGFSIESHPSRKDGAGLLSANEWLLNFVDSTGNESELETVPSWVLENMLENMEG